MVGRGFFSEWSEHLLEALALLSSGAAWNGRGMYDGAATFSSHFVLILANGGSPYCD